MPLRRDALQLYKRLIKLSNQWRAKDANLTQIERDYIKNEARTLFQLNKNLTDKNDIIEHLREGEARIEIALHYEIPYPRPVNLPTYTLHSKRQTKSERELRGQSIPIYMKSQFKKK